MRDIDDNNIIGEEEESNFDSPIFIFPDDVPDDDSDDTSLSSDDGSAPRLFGGSGGLSFDHVDAVKKEKEFIYMPFLDDTNEPDDDGESSALSFSKVKAVKKENEFIFLPFLNDADNNNDDEKAKDEPKYHLRSDGTLFDEGLILMPLSPLDDDEEESDESDGNDSSDDENYDDVGIYVTDASSDGYIPRTPKVPGRNTSSPKPGGKKKRPPAPHGAPSKKGGKKGGKGMPTADEQFRAAMMNINPEIRRAAMRDPIQRAALEQAVRIALVQQAAQEAVAMTTGSPGGYGNNFGQPPVHNQGKRGKKRPAPASAPFQAPLQTNSGSSSSLASSVKGFTFGGFSSSPSEFNVGDSAAAPSAPIPAQPVNMAGNQGDVADYNPAGDMQSAHSPDMNQDPIIASLSASSANQGAPSANQDPAIASLNRTSSGNSKPINTLSPAAVRAAMRAGANLTNLPNNSSAPSSALPQNSLSAQKAKLQEAVDTRRSGCLIWIIVSFIVFFIGLIAIAIWPSLSTEMKYQQASTLLENGQYLEAGKAFAKLEDYKDSETKSNEAVYTYASSILESGAYETALELFNSISTYSNSSERIAECRYALGKRYMESGEYAEAYDHLRHIPRYADAGDLAMESNYKCATALYEEENYESARIRFNMFPDYQDSYAMWQVSQYKCAEQLMTSSDFENAYALFTELGDYVNSPYRAAIAHYNMLLNGSSSSVDDVIATLQILEEYNTDPEAVSAIQSYIFTPARLLGRWQSIDDSSYMEYRIEDNVHKLILFIDGLDTAAVTYENVKFDNNTVIYQSVDANDSIIRIELFAEDDAAAPDAVNFFCFKADTDYTMQRVG